MFVSQVQLHSLFVFPQDLLTVFKDDEYAVMWHGGEHNCYCVQQTKGQQSVRNTHFVCCWEEKTGLRFDSLGLRLSLNTAVAIGCIRTGTADFLDEEQKLLWVIPLIRRFSLHTQISNYCMKVVMKLRQIIIPAHTNSLLFAPLFHFFCHILLLREQSQQTFSCLLIVQIKSTQRAAES